MSSGSKNGKQKSKKLAEHLVWSNNKAMRTLARKSPIQLPGERLTMNGGN